MAMNLQVTSREFYSPVRKEYDGCPCSLTPKEAVTLQDPTKRRSIVYDYTTMVLQHFSKKNEDPINELSLKKIHYELESTYFQLANSGSSNILLSKLSFDCKIVDTDGNEIRDYIVFDLKIPSFNENNAKKLDEVFCFDSLERKYGSKANLYRVLQSFYEKGRDIANPKKKDKHGKEERAKHGTEVDFDPNRSGHDQFIRHTEQMLVGYLVRKEGAEMVFKRLQTEIRSKYPNAKEVKTYNMGLHMHSTKTCCAPCENSLIGLMEPAYMHLVEISGKNEIFSFFYHFEQASLQENNTLKIRLPNNSGFTMVTTVTASTKDGIHATEPSYRKIQPEDIQKEAFYGINTKDPESAQKIHTTFLGENFDIRKVSDETDLSEITVGVSGSKTTKSPNTNGSKGTINKIKELKKKELDTLSEKINWLNKDITKL